MSYEVVVEPTEEGQLPIKKSLKNALLLGTGVGVGTGVGTITLHLLKKHLPDSAQQIAMPLIAGAAATGLGMVNERLNAQRDKEWADARMKNVYIRVPDSEMASNVKRLLKEISPKHHSVRVHLTSSSTDTPGHGREVELPSMLTGDALRALIWKKV